MKIGLISTETFDRPGGIKEHIKALKNEFLDKGHEVKVIIPRRKPDEEYDETVDLIGGAVSVPGNGGWTTLSFGFKPFAIPELLAEERFDILHVHNPGFFLSMQVLAEAQKYPAMKKVLTVHGLPDESFFWNSIPGLKEFVGEWYAERIDGLIVVSEPVLSHIPDTDQINTVIIPNGVDLERFSPSQPPIREFPRSTTNILFVGRIEKRKGLKYLLKAYEVLLRDNDDISLTIVGDGPQRWTLEQWAKVKDLNNVVFVGRVSDEDLPRYYTGADIFCSPAIYGESFGIVLLEAMASGVPLVAFGNKGYQTVLQDIPYKDAVVSPKDVDSLAASLQQVIDDTLLRERMSAWGLEEAKKYSWGEVSEEILHFYESLRSENIQTA